MMTKINNNDSLPHLDVYSFRLLILLFAFNAHDKILEFFPYWWKWWLSLSYLFFLKLCLVSDIIKGWEMISLLTGHCFFFSSNYNIHCNFLSFAYYFSIQSELTKFTQTLDLFYGQLCWYIWMWYSIVNSDTKKGKKKLITFWNVLALARKALTFSSSWVV